MINIKRTGHTAILVENVEEAAKFYNELFGFEIVYCYDDWGLLRKNKDDIALIKKGVTSHPPHFGLRVSSNHEVDDAYKFLSGKNIKILKEPKLHRDNSYSFYFTDRDGNVVELIHDPNI